MTVDDAVGPAAWRGQALHVVADTDFAHGQGFLRAWRRWRDDPERCDRLHWAAASTQPPHAGALRQLGLAEPDLAELTTLLSGVWPDRLGLGHHVFALEGGRVTLTLCVGEDGVAVLRGWRFLADTCMLAPSTPPEALHTLARLAHQDTRLVCALPTPELTANLPRAGFTVTSPAGHHPLTARYAPRWPAPTAPDRRPSRVAVLGAGLAGAAACYAFTRRGWRTTLLDRADGPANGASSLPAGLLSPHATAEPTPLSRLTDLGARWMRRELAQWLPEGAVWRAGVLRVDGSAPPEWLPDAVQVTPDALVRAWLAQADATGRLSTHWRQPVQSLQKNANGWVLKHEGNSNLQETPHVVVATAWGGQALLAPWGGAALALSPVRGQLSLAPVSGLSPDQADRLPPHPVNGAGVFLPRVEWRGQTHWATGATYERGESAVQVSEGNHRANLQSLQGWMPELADALGPAFSAHGEGGTGVAGWAQIRCATGDRLPLAGTLPDLAALQAHRPLEAQARLAGLHALAGLGSRGLTLALLCAEVLASRLAHEPLPVPADLADALDPARFALRQARRGRPVEHRR